MNSPTINLPLVRISDLSEKAKDFVLALANGRDLTPSQAVQLVLDRAADQQPQPQPEGAVVHAALMA